MPLDLNGWGELTGGGPVPLTPLPPFDPSSIPGLLAWWDASTLTESSGATVDSWTSSDPNAYTLGRSGTPTMNVNFLGKRAVEFNGGSFLGGAIALAQLIDGTAAFQAYLVGSLTDSALFKTAWCASNQVANQVTYAAGPTELARLSKGVLFTEQIDETFTGPLTGNFFSSVAFNGTKAFFRLNGSAQSSYNTTFTVAPGCNVMSLGARNLTSISNFWLGSIAQVIFYDHVLTASEISSLESWIVTTYPGI